jgi:hypothetical protein
VVGLIGQALVFGIAIATLLRPEPGADRDTNVKRAPAAPLQRPQEA